MWIVNKIKKSLEFNKNKKNYEKNLQEYELLMKDKIGYTLNYFEVFSEMGISFKIHTEKFIIDYTIWENEILKRNEEFEIYGDISKFVSKDKTLNTEKRDSYYANTMSYMLHCLKNNKITIFNDKKEVIKELENVSFDNVKIKYFPHIEQAMNLIIDDLKLNQSI